jgi:hypothetical protein
MATLQYQNLQIRVGSYNISQEASAVLTKMTELKNQFLESTTVIQQQFEKLHCIHTVVDGK